jgi:hypothetical protein
MSPKQWIVIVSISAGLGYMGGTRAAGIPASTPMTFSGIVQADGVPVTTDTTVRVRLFAALQGGNDLCETSDVVTPDAQGRFSLALIDDCTDVVSANSTLFAEVQIGSEVLTPRQPLGAVPYAVEAKKASEASGGLAIAIADLQGSVRPEQIFTATFASSGVVTNQHPQWISTSTLNGTGDGNVTFSISLDNPVCIATGVGGGVTAGATSVGSTNAVIQTRINQTAAPARFSLMCHGAPL